MSKGFASNYRIVLIASGLFVCFGAVGVRLVRLHVLERDTLLKTIARARENLIAETARRGDIRDANGGILATSSSRLKVGVDPFSLRPQDEKKWPQLAELLGLPEAELRRKFLTQFRESAGAGAGKSDAKSLGFAVNLTFPWLAAASSTTAEASSDADDTLLESNPDESVPRKIRWATLRGDVSEKLFAEIVKLDIKGVRGERFYQRSYPNNQLAAHLVGFVNRQQDAAGGVEGNFDFYLRGQDGWRIGERDGRGRDLPQFLTRQVPASNGYSVILSINMIVQDIVEEELALIAERYEPLKASIIVSDPRTGFILGMAN